MIYYTHLDANGTKLIDRMVIAKGTSGSSIPSCLDFGIPAILIAMVAVVVSFKKAHG